MAYEKSFLLKKAIKIAKAHAKSGNTRSVELVLRRVYEELKKINQELE